MEISHKQDALVGDGGGGGGCGGAGAALVARSSSHKMHFDFHAT